MKILLMYILVTMILTLRMIHAQADYFVRVDPKDRRFFILNNQRFQFQGTNQREAAIGLSESQIEYTMKQNRDHYMRVVRVWAFNEDWCGSTGCFIYKNNQGGLGINDQALERLDQVIFYANMYGIKIVLVPVNFETSFGGMQWWVDTFKGPGNPKEDFYRDQNIQNLFRQYLSALANRVNTKNKRIYKFDATIMAWDTANEPHTTDGVDRSGKMVADYICNTAYFLKKQVGVKQMVTSGEEGYMTNGPLDGVNKGHEWVNNGLKGVDFATNAKCQNLDYMTVHLYPDNWEIQPYEFSNYINSFLADHARLSHENGKPLVVEEFGCCLAAPYRGRRAEMFQHYLNAFHSKAIAGQMVWQLFPSGSPLARDTEHYDFTYDSDRASAKLLVDEGKRLF